MTSTTRQDVSEKASCGPAAAGSRQCGLRSHLKSSLSRFQCRSLKTRLRELRCGEHGEKEFMVDDGTKKGANSKLLVLSSSQLSRLKEATVNGDDGQRMESGTRQLMVV
ncbi:hypothetical protein M5K25_007094 [Dendrobium thyrsiflorum]|uniref:Uncharacterized protein n=1 Tax=Dendrobium thyrsiflorum TaxID=117978 RepID=A0ABD0VD86_DENTH